MTSPIKQFYLWMTNQQDKRVQLGIPLSPEDTDKFKALIQENNALKAQLGLRLAEEKRKYEEEKQVDKEQEIIYDLKKQLKRRRILLPVDKNFNHTPDIENMEMNDIEYDEDTDTYKESMEYKARVKDLIVKYLKELRDKSEYIERLELTQIEQARQINDLKRATLVLRNQSQTSQSELSNAMGLTMQFNSKIGEMNRKIASLTEIKALYEGIISSLS